MKYHLENDFLTKEECYNLIEFHNNNFGNLGYFHRDTEVITLTQILNQDDFFKYIYAKISHHIQKIDPDTFVNYFEVVKWPENSLMTGHYDFDYHTYTSVVYLNDNFTGGETFISDLSIKPKTGSIVTFKGKSNIHGVLKVTGGNRYTLPVWYKTLYTEKSGS